MPDAGNNTSIQPLQPAVDEVLWISNPKLRTVSKPVDPINDATRSITQRLFAVLDATGESAIAAIQIGIAQQIIAINMDDSHGQHQRLALINPRVLSRSAETTTNLESCSSIPGHPLAATRAREVTIAYANLDGASCELHADGAFAVCIQHELEHLQGRSLADTLSPLKRSRLVTQLSKQLGKLQRKGR